MRPMNRIRRRRAERLASFKCTVTRIVDRVKQPDHTYKDVKAVVYGGPDHPEQTCKVQGFRPYETVVASGGRDITVQRTEIHVPIGAGPFMVGDIFEVEGHRFPLRVAGLDDKSIQTMQRLLVDQQSDKKVT